MKKDRKVCLAAFPKQGHHCSMETLAVITVNALLQVG